METAQDGIGEGVAGDAVSAAAGIGPGQIGRYFSVVSLIPAVVFVSYLRWLWGTGAWSGAVNLDAARSIDLADTFAVVDEHTVACLDPAASGAETTAHLRQNGRITIMFCSFERTPNIVRFYGRGRVISLYDDEYAEWASRFPPNPAARSVIVVDVDRVSDSCGYSLPLMSLDEERDILTRTWSAADRPASSNTADSRTESASTACPPTTMMTGELTGVAAPERTKSDRPG
jgi:hypothetical protein